MPESTNAEMKYNNEFPSAIKFYEVQTWSERSYIKRERSVTFSFLGSKVATELP